MFVLKWFKRLCKFFIFRFIALLFFLVLSPLYFFASLLSRFIHREKVGLGPEPLINNVHHKKALQLNGIKAETFVNHTYWITSDFDINIKKHNSYFFFFYLIFSYKMIFIYFNGGLLSFAPYNFFIKFLEPLFYKLAGIKTILFPYGGDIQNFNYHNDVVYKSAYITDYPLVLRRIVKRAEANIKFQTRYADWIIAGCDWVNYLPYWDTLMLAHFSIDMKKWYVPQSASTSKVRKFTKIRPLKILHAPNHKAIKGTCFIEKIIGELRTENYPIEYSRVENIPNDKFVSFVQEADVIIDQLVIGWYGIFALEAMACKKPVLIYIDPKLKKLYTMSGLLEPGELPCIETDYQQLKSNIVHLIENPLKILEIGLKSYEFVHKHHSLEYVGKVFADIINKLEKKG